MFMHSLKILFKKYLPIGSLLGALFFSIPVYTMDNQGAVQIDPGSEMYPRIKKISDTFYIGKIKDKPLWLVMERIQVDKNLNLWKRYISEQLDDTAIIAHHAYNFTTDGSRYFSIVLNEIDPTLNEIWVAYITTNDNPKPIQDSDLSLIKHDLSHTRFRSPRNTSPFAKDIQMFVTVTSSPEALITSHMGISKTLESLYKIDSSSPNFSNISMDLHSFAAKVMLMRNPERKYQLNTPVRTMELIMLKSMPQGSVFLRTREYERRLNATEDYFIGEKENIRKNMIKTFLNMYGTAKIHLKIINDYNSRLNNSEKKILQAKVDLGSGKISNEEYDTILTGSKNTIMNFKNSILKKQESLEKLQQEYIEEKLNYKNWHVEQDPAFKEQLKLHPPLISVDDWTGITAFEKLIIYNKDNPDEPWLTITKDDPRYNFVFQEVFLPYKWGSTQFVLVDLLALANLKPLD